MYVGKLIFMDPKFISLSFFITSYLLFIFLQKRRVLIAVISVILLILSRVISIKDAFFSINWNVMAILVGTSMVADIFIKSRLPTYLAEIIIDKARNTGWAILFLCLLTGFISTFVENVTTILIVAPIAFSLAKKLKINPTKMMIALAISSNLQSTATLIGDPPSMLLGSFAKMDFGDFFFYQGKPSIFFAVEFGALCSFFVLYFIFKNYKEKAQLLRVERVKSWLPTIIFIGLILSLVFSSFLNTNFSYLTGMICLVFGIISILWEKFLNKGSIFKSAKSLDWETIFFLIGVFILVGSITLTGWIKIISGFFSNLVGTNIFWGYTLIVFVSVFLSAFIDNVPFLATMLPVIASLADKLMVNPSLFLFGLIIGTSLGGNITPIGASANIVTCGLLKKEGYSVKFQDFIKIGLPFTLVAISAAYLFIWFVWKI